MNQTPVAAETGMPALRFSTEMFAPRERLAAWREFIGRGLLKLDIEPHSDGEFRAEATLRVLPGLSIVAGSTTAARNERPQQLIDTDDFLLSIVRVGTSRFSACGREAISSVGDAVLVGGGEGGVKDARADCQFLSLRVPQEAIGSTVKSLNDSICRRIPASNPALRQLTQYLGVLRDTEVLATPALQRTTVTHIHDLIALILGATREASEFAKTRGLSAARLKAIKDDIAKNLDQEDLSAGGVAVRHQITPRYLHMLFESEGVTFSEYVLDARLARAHRMLSNPRHTGEKISSIVLDAGFSDLSYFYRVFRRRYGMSPSDVRAQMRPENPGSSRNFGRLS